MRNYSNNKEINEFIHALLKNKQAEFCKGKKHDKLKIGNHKIPIPKTPSDYRSVKNFIGDVNRLIKTMEERRCNV
ncbi:MAG: hypothetical protein K0U45_04360 [Alphaproteobacteria bacterium]|nr:hypothetical protein [Alphaproteobacteria bacterium]